MSALAIVETAAPAELPDLDAAVAQVEKLVAAKRADVLDEARARAEAYALYEKRNGAAEREQHFARLRLLAEAGLGVLSFDEPSVLAPNARASYRTLASAFERGKLLNVLDSLANAGAPLTTHNVTCAVRQRGYTYAPGASVGKPHIASVPWSQARYFAREFGISLVSVPADREKVRRAREVAREAAARLRAVHVAAARERRTQARAQLKRVAKERGPQIDEAYSLLRRCLQVLHDAQGEFTREERRGLEDAFSGLYQAEFGIGVALGVRRPDDEGRYWERHS